MIYRDEYQDNVSQPLDPMAVTFVGEQQGDAAYALRRTLSSIFSKYSQVLRAYLARVQYGNSPDEYVALCILAAPFEDSGLSEAIGKTISRWISTDASCDVIYINREQDSELRLVCWPFYDESQEHLGVGSHIFRLYVSSLSKKSTKSAVPLTISRRLTPLISAACIAAAFPILWVFEQCWGVGAAFVLMPAFSCFVLLFAVPVTAWALYLAINHQPILAVRDSHICVSHVAFPWRTATLPVSEIREVQDDWYPDSSHRRIVFTVSDAEFENQRHNKAWVKRTNGRLWLDLLNTTTQPDVAVAKLFVYLTQFPRIES